MTNIREVINNVLQKTFSETPRFGQTTFSPVGRNRKSLVVFPDKFLLGPNKIKPLVGGGFLSHISGNVTELVQPKRSK